jgi:hypothetical protein
MDASADLLFRIREAGRESMSPETLMADIWSQAQNVPFMTTVYEAVQEAKTGPETRCGSSATLPIHDQRPWSPAVIGGERLN